MTKILAVYDADPVFAKRLADYVNQKETGLFAAMAFSSLDRLKEYGDSHSIEILLVDERSRSAVGDVKAKQIMVLNDGEITEEKKARELIPVIYKFQSGDCIMREVLASYCGCSLEPALAFMGARATVVGVYSPINRCQKSALALVIAQLLSREERVLYLNLEEYSGFSRLICSEYSWTLSDVLYLYQQGQYNWVKLKSMISNWGNMDYIPPVRYGEDLSQVDPEDMAHLIDRIAREGGYKKIVVDVGQMGRGALSLLSICDAVYMPVKDDLVSMAKLEEFEEYLGEADQTDVKGRIQRLKLPENSTVLRGENYMEQLLWGELGDYVRRLLNGGRPKQL